METRQTGTPGHVSAITNLAWVLIYLDGLETNLKMIRATSNCRKLNIFLY